MTRLLLLAAFWTLPASAQGPVAAQAQKALHESSSQFWDGNSRRGDVADPVPGFSPKGAPAASAALTAAVPAITRTTEVPGPRLAPAVSPEAGSCRRALAAHAFAARLCDRHPTLAPLLAGLLDAFRQQFGTAEGIATNILWILVSVLLSALSGFGAVLKVVTGIVSLGLSAWMIWPLVTQGYDAVKGLRGSAPGSPERYASLFSLGVVGGTLLILGLLTAAGWAIGKTKAGARMVGGLDSALDAGAAKLGLSRAPLGESPAGAFAGFFNTVNTPEAPAARMATGAARGAAFQGGHGRTE